MKSRSWLFAVAVLLVPLVVRAELKLPGMFSDHAVLQAGIEIPVWGWASSGEHVEVALGDKTATATAGSDGRWIVRLPAMQSSSAPLVMTINVGDEKRTINDILIGEVWLGSGQSNMTFAMTRTDDASDAIAKADAPTIRLFTVPRRAVAKVAADVEGQWEICTPKTVAPFSAVLYHFGSNIHDQLNCPVGLIHSSWGGTPIQAWMPRETFAGGDAEITRQHDRIMQRYPESTAPATNRAPRNVHLEPTRLFNGMIAPVAPYSIRGMVWYQGENNVHQGDVSDYATMMQAMVGSWRKLWGQGEFPFFYVQIAPYGKYPKSGSPLPEMWEQQTRSLAIIPSSGMAAISDLGNPGDIHPKNKREVGRRLSSIALAKTYNVEGVECDAPMLVSAQREGHKVRVHLSGGAGLKSRDGKPLNFFEVAGGDGAFSPAKASIDGADIVVECAAIAEPSSVRFGWDATAAPNLVNGAGLPAVAFRAAVK